VHRARILASERSLGRGQIDAQMCREGFGNDGERRQEIVAGMQQGWKNLASGGRRRERRCRRFSTSPGTVILRSSFSWPLDFTERVHTICPLSSSSLVGSWYRPRSPPLEFDTYQCKFSIVLILHSIFGGKISNWSRI
jgi:hypothetical protein